MARGWESKAVESQIETAHSNREEPARKPTTPEAAATVRKRETLRLARNHVQQQIQASQHPRHRALLEGALEDLERQLAALDEPGKSVGGS